jgi:hypothetical protein
MAEMKLRHIRVNEQLWRRAMTKAHSDGVNLSKLIRDFLDDYASDDDSTVTELKRIIVRLNKIHKRLKIGESEYETHRRRIEEDAAQMMIVLQEDRNE